MAVELDKNKVQTNTNDASVVLDKEPVVITEANVEETRGNIEYADNKPMDNIQLSVDKASDVLASKLNTVTSAGPIIDTEQIDKSMDGVYTKVDSVMQGNTMQSVKNTLGNVSNSLNAFADKLTGSNIPVVKEGGIEGLGNINLN